MEIKGKVIVVTGAANGIGAALAKRFSMLNAKAVVICDIDEKGVESLAQNIGKTFNNIRFMKCDVANRLDLEVVVSSTIKEFGQIDLFCSNAGIIVSGDQSTPTSEWQRAWDVNVMAHVNAANAVLPDMLERGEGYLLNTCSAAGMLTSVGAAPYAVTKHGALAFAEWLSITYGLQGIKVSALCPQVVRTKMIEDAIETGAGSAVTSGGVMLESEDVAMQVVEALAKEQFLILTHEETQKFAERKVADIDKWILGMQKYAANQAT